MATPALAAVPWDHQKVTPGIPRSAMVLAFVECDSVITAKSLVLSSLSKYLSLTSLLEGAAASSAWEFHVTPL